MHPGKLTGQGAAARLYRALTALPGHWFGGDELAAAALTTCVSTRVSEVRHQLPVGERIEHRVDRINGELKQFYRIVREFQARAVPEPTGAGAPLSVPPMAESPAPGLPTQEECDKAAMVCLKLCDRIVLAPGSLFAEGPVPRPR